MTKEIIVKLNLECDDECYTNDDLIKQDLEAEITCCWNCFDIKEIIIKDIVDKG